nr:hypothetical protein [uncultured Chryseobacterium sp.]
MIIFNYGFKTSDISIISGILFFFSHHGFLSILIFIMFFGILTIITKKGWWLIFILPLSIANSIAGQFLNARFLNKFGVESTAIITSDIETNSMLNEQYIHDYEAIVKKLDGHYVETFFSTMSAAIYPIENTIRILRVGSEFPVKFIPGCEKNIVILYGKFEEGIRIQKYELQIPVNSARIKYEADRTNKKFIEEYIKALEDYLKVYANEEYSLKAYDLKKELSGLKK